MSYGREEGVERLTNYDCGEDHPYYLHYRSLFADLASASQYACGRLLDIGCGNKPYKRMFAARVNEHIGCDVAQSDKREVDIICSATEIPVADGSFDTVLSTQVIEHVADHSAMLGEAYRVLKPGGVLILSGPMYWPLHEEPYDYFRFTEHGLRHLFSTVGFERIEVCNNGGKWALCGQVIIHTLRNTRFGRPFIWQIVNRIFGWLDDLRPTRDNPMNYVVTARKP